MRWKASARGMQSTNDGHLPTTVTGTRKLRGPVRVPSNISSQYLTSLLIIAPLLESGLVIEVEGELTSKPYVDLTLDEMAKFGVRVVNHDYRRLVRGAAGLSREHIDVEGDASAASYFAALATLHGARITLSNLGSEHAPGRLCVFRAVRKARRARRANRRAAPSSKVRAGSTRGFDGEVDMTSMPDVAPTLMMLAPFLTTPTRITGLATLRVKECDRIAAPTRELRKLGVTVEEGPDYMVIEPLAARSIARDRRSRGNRDLSRPPHRDVVWRARFAPAGPADSRSGLRGEDLSELLEGLATRAKHAATLISVAAASAALRVGVSPWNTMRLRGIGPEVLLLCFLIIGAAAFALGRRSARGRRLRRDVDYFAGLDHLVNDRFDRATEVFTRLATKSHEADIQFALGSLMRKRGEVDRAIAIHTELAATANC